MLPKKLFTPKCLHTDRDTVFQEDFLNFFNFIIYEMSEGRIINSIPISNASVNINLNTKEEIKDKSQNILHKLNYKSFKFFWNFKKMSMLHFSKSKEENPKEFYEVLFGEVQYFILYGNRVSLKNLNTNNEINLNKIYKILAIYSMYSIYYTQISEYFYQINTIPEILFEINKLLKEEFLLNCENFQEVFVKIKRIKKEIAFMIDKLNLDDAFSIGTIIGLKTIILNKYGLPLEQRSNVYRDYVDINNTKILLDKMKIEEKEKNKNNKKNLDDYVNIKRETVNLMKNMRILSSHNFNKQLYCDFINEKLKNSSSNHNFNFSNINQSENNILNFDLTFFPNHMDLLNLNKDDFDKNKITNLDLQFNQIEDN